MTPQLAQATNIDVTSAKPAASETSRAGSAATGENSDIAYDIIDTPIGPMLLAVTEIGLVRVAFEREDFETVLQTLAAKISPKIAQDPQRLESITEEFDEYFAGKRHKFSISLDHRLSSGFRQEVQRYLANVGYGQTRTYKEVSAEMGKPGASRAVGSGCATNPLSIVLPCHRVLRSDGGLGGYLGGLDAKKYLLTLERDN